MKFSVIVVSLNAGDKLYDTVQSALSQEGVEFEIVIKDGLSSDGSVDRVRALGDERIRIFEMNDTGIYDGMNQAITHAEGDFLIFMNCGDHFYDEKVLARFADAAAKEIAEGGEPDEKSPVILYGCRYSSLTKNIEYISPKITPLVCYRNIPCHQAICYSRYCFTKRLYKPEYRIRADYEHFLWSVLKAGARTVYVEEPVCRYEGGGYSESPKNIKRSAQEHKEITGMYLTKWELFYCRLYMIVTLQPLRKSLSSGPLSGAYNKLVKKIYKRA
ncbi:MAG: glycosyltransferase [Lachnospiraceae bacterium]|nr:glycosyltransferase [Lachnospiraceae bacterium]